MKYAVHRKFQILSVICDALLVFISYYIATGLRFDVLDGMMILQLSPWQNLALAAGYSLLVVVLEFQFKLYKMSLYHRCRKAAVKLMAVNGVGILILIAGLYVLRISDFSRLLILLLWGISCLLQLLRRVVVNRIVKQWLKDPNNSRHVIIVGYGHLAEQFARDIRDNPEWGIILDGHISSKENVLLGQSLGSYEEIETILEKYPQDELVVALEAHELHFMLNILAVAEKEGTHLHMIPFFNDVIPASAMIEHFDRTKMINMRTVRVDDFGNAFMKRAMDIFGSLAIILLTSPIMLVASIGVKLSSPGPIVFKQSRVGKNKKNFDMLKFRSMRITGTEDTGWSTSGDNRRTRFGRFIRKYSIDELPQLFNVLRGEMSLVGPRPEIPYHVNHFKNEVSLYLLRQQVKPGMTGWAQIHGLRGDTSIEDRVQYDLWYIEHWSIWLDIKIIFLTVFGHFINKEE